MLLDHLVFQKRFENYTVNLIRLSKLSIYALSGVTISTSRNISEIFDMRAWNYQGLAAEVVAEAEAQNIQQGK